MDDEKKPLTIECDAKNNKLVPKILLAFLLKGLYGNNRIVWLSPLLFIYGFSFLIIRDIVAEMYRLGGSYSKWHIIPISCLLLFEVLNQITYRLAKQSREKAIMIKAVFFWFIFTLYSVSDILIRLYDGNKSGTWIFSDKWPAILFLLLVSWLLPSYSFSPDWRFYVLHGKFESKLFGKT